MHPDAAPTSPSSPNPSESDDPLAQSAPAGAIDFAPGVWLARGHMRFSFSRSSGPGGQNVNKLSTRAELRVTISNIHGLDEWAAYRLRTLAGRRLTQDGEIVLHADTTRSQLDNKQECIARLTEMVRRALVRPKTRRKTKPSKASRLRRLEGKRRTGEKKSIRRGRKSLGDD